VQNQNRSLRASVAIEDGGRIHFQIARFRPANLDFAVRHGVFCFQPREQASQFRTAKRLHDSLPAHVHVERELLFERLIDQLNPAGAIQEHHTFRHAVEQSLAFGLALILQFALALEDGIAVFGKLQV
jgi:hypothetical protein